MASLLAVIEKKLEVVEKEHEKVQIETQQLRQQQQDQQKVNTFYSLGTWHDTFNFSY